MMKKAGGLEGREIARYREKESSHLLRSCFVKGHT